MRGAFGKPQGTVARVHIGQPIMSIRSKEHHQASCLEAFRRAKFKFPGRQKVDCYSACITVITLYLFYIQIVVSKKWGFTKYDKGDYEEMRQNGRLIPCGVHAKYIPDHGPLAEWERMQLQ